jgi:hypothetical protein
MKTWIHSRNAKAVVVALLAVVAMALAAVGAGFGTSPGARHDTVKISINNVR